MKEALSSFDLRILAAELRILEGGYLDKVYQSEDSLVLRFRLPKKGKRELFVEPGKWFFFGSELEKPRVPPAFAQSLRKVLGNASVRQVQQRGFDRILTIDLQKAEGFTLVFEMFGKGNLVLLQNGTVLHALRYGKWGSREVRRGHLYRPPAEFPDPTSLDLKAFTELLTSRTGSVVKILAAGLGLGRLYAEETCLRAGVDKGRPVRDLAEAAIEAVFAALQSLVEGLKTPAPTVVLDGEPVDVVPFPLQVYAGQESRTFGTLSEALEAYVFRDREAAAPPDKAVAKVERRIAKQEEMLVDLGEEVGRIDKAVTYIYAHYQEVDRALRQAREEKAEAVAPGTASLELGPGAGEVPLDIHLEVDENARRLYERKKALTSKTERVQAALQESRKALDAAQQRAVRREKRKVAYRPSKRFWFDAYRWSLTRNRFLVLAGRDAKSNEKLVRKHLEAGDRYCHADLTGAPSVIVKGGAEASEEDLREACRFGLVFSKAWGVGVGSGSAYWVTPEQVSKTAESGESLGTGAFVVRGRRHYVHNLALEVGLGQVVIEEAERVIAADPEGMEELASQFVVLSPAGPLNRATLTHRLSDAFRVPPVEIERALPAGTYTLERVTGLDLPSS